MSMPKCLHPYQNGGLPEGERKSSVGVGMSINVMCQLTGGEDVVCGEFAGSVVVTF